MKNVEPYEHSSNLKNEDSQFTQMVSQALSRRNFMKGLGTMGMGAFFAMSPLSKAIANTQKLNDSSPLLTFEPVPASTKDTVIVPKGYTAKALISWGDPIFDNAPEFDPSGKAPASAQARQFGDNTDGMHCFPIDENRAVMAVNNEYINPEYLFDHKGDAMTAKDVKKGQAAHGVSIFEIQRNSSTWQVNKSGTLNRRITANTPMEMTGPAAGHSLLKTAADPEAKTILGTLNNCANGVTPWGTYLTCEENIHNYFGAPEGTQTTAEQQRYGITPSDQRYQWSKFDPRFNFAKNPNEPNRFGWVVEIDPMNPTSTPKKRSALGRFKHENAALTINKDGHIVVYLGDDERGEHLYKFVSTGKYNPNNPQENRELLEDGTLYVAKFSMNTHDGKGQGEWLELTYGKNGLTKENGFPDQATVMVFARKAATIVGATTMDRPEWVAIHPNNKTVFCTLTNNSDRGIKTGQYVGGPNPRAKNHYGQIIRWNPANDDHTATTFEWDLYVLAGNPTVHKDTYAGSQNISAENMFNSPDGIGFDGAGRLWILTDGKYSNQGDFAGMGNNQMLCGDPETGEIKRFMTGPIACEITGLTFSADQKTLFVGIQHPGEKGAASHFPSGGDSKPRSTIMMITRDDGRSFAV